MKLTCVIKRALRLNGPRLMVKNRKVESKLDTRVQLSGKLKN